MTWFHSSLSLPRGLMNVIWLSYRTHSDDQTPSSACSWRWMKISKMFLCAKKALSFLRKWRRKMCWTCSHQCMRSSFNRSVQLFDGCDDKKKINLQKTIDWFPPDTYEEEEINIQRRRVVKVFFLSSLSALTNDHTNFTVKTFVRTRHKRSRRVIKHGHNRYSYILGDEKWQFVVYKKRGKMGRKFKYVCRWGLGFS